MPTEKETDAIEARAATFEFDRYINGRLMAEGVTICRCRTLPDAILIASRLCSREPGEVATLVPRNPDVASLREVRQDALRKAAGIAKTAWLTCPIGEIADADVLNQVGEYTANAILALAKAPPHAKPDDEG